MRIKSLWIILAIGALLVSRLLGDGAILWSKGGDHGIVNLPCFASASSNRNVAYSAASVATTTCSNQSPAVAKPTGLGFEMKDIDRGAQLVLPSMLTSCIVQFKTQGLTIGFSTAKGAVHIDGRDLVMLRDNDISGFELQLIDGEENYLDIEFKLTANAQSYQIIVR